MSTIRLNTTAYFIRTIPFLASDHLLLLSFLSIRHKTKTTPSHFIKTITNYQKSNWTSFKRHVEDLIFHRTHSTNVHKAFMRQTNILSKQYRILTDSSSLKKIKIAQIALHLPRYIHKLIQLCNHTCKRNRSPQIITLTIT